MKRLAHAAALLAALLAAPGAAPADQGFYAKTAEYQGIPIKAAAVVGDEALLKARESLARLLSKTPDIVWNLRAEGAELHLIGRDQKASDLPEYRHYKGQLWEGEVDFDERARGLGDRTVACAEENLLSLPTDRFDDHREVCIHEIAHAIMGYGVSEAVRRKIVRQYRRSMGRGLWRTSYAAKTPDEFFAELAMWYHAAEGNAGELGGIMGSGPQWLGSYDPEAYKLIDDILSAREPVERLVELRPLPADREEGLRPRFWGKATAITVVNGTPRELQAVRLTYWGKRKHCGKVMPGEPFRVETRAAQPWLFLDDGGKVLAIFVAEPRPGFAAVR